MNAFDPTHPRRHDEDRKFRRGMYLLPSLFTVGNMFCGYAAIVYAMHGQLEIAATFIGIAFVVDSLDGSVARLTGTSSAFGVQLDSLADVMSFGLAPAILAFSWGLSELGRKGLATSFLFVVAAAMRLARFNIQSSAQLDKRYFVGMPSPAAGGVIAATVYAWPNALTPPPAGGDGWWAFAHVGVQALALAVVLVPAALMVSTIRFRSFKTINFGWGPSYMPALLFALLLAAIFADAQITLPIIAYGYLASAFVGIGITRMRARRTAPPGPG
jgi:CDP-diacylglycerol---serine O-phosphatidyltransferase